MLRFEKMTVPRRRRRYKTHRKSAAHHESEIEPIHLLAALVSQVMVWCIVAHTGWVPSETLSQEIGEEWPAAKSAGFRPKQHMGKAFECRAGARVSRKADSFKDEYVRTEHLFLQSAAQDREPAGNC